MKKMAWLCIKTRPSNMFFNYITSLSLCFTTNNLCDGSFSCVEFLTPPPVSFVYTRTLSPQPFKTFVYQALWNLDYHFLFYFFL